MLYNLALIDLDRFSHRKNNPKKLTTVKVHHNIADLNLNVGLSFFTSPRLRHKICCRSTGTRCPSSAIRDIPQKQAVSTHQSLWKGKMASAYIEAMYCRFY